MWSRLTCATFSPIFGVWRLPWKNFPEPLSWERQKIHYSCHHRASTDISPWCDQKAHWTMTNCHCGHPFAPNFGVLVRWWPPYIVVNHFLMTHMENIDVIGSQIYLFIHTHIYTYRYTLHIHNISNNSTISNRDIWIYMEM